MGTIKACIPNIGSYSDLYSAPKSEKQAKFST